jgi:hypothetical protein
MHIFYGILIATKGNLEVAHLTGGAVCENQLDYYTALRKAGLGQYVPNQFKQRRYPSMQSFPAHRTTTLQQAMLKDHERYCATVPPEWRYGTSYQNAMQPSGPVQLKQMHQHAMNVFDRAIGQLQSFERAGR